MVSWSRNSIVRAPLLLLGVGEFLVLFSSVNVAAILIFGDLAVYEETVGPILPKAITISAVLMFSLVAMGLYHFHLRASYNEVIVRLAVGIAAGSLVLAAIFYLLPATRIGPKTALIAMSYSLVFLMLFRLVFVRSVDENMFRRRIIVFGAGEKASAIWDLRRKADWRGFQIVGQVAAPNDAKKNATRKGLLPDVGSLMDCVTENNVDEIVIAVDDRRGNLPIRELLNCKLRGVGVIDVIEFLERESGKIRVDLVNPGWLIFSPGFRVSSGRRYSKRILDLTMSAVACFLIFPLMLLVSLAIKIEDGIRAPVIYKQLRVGKSGEVFYVFKFRSMSVDAEADGKAVWAAENDNRITKVGKVIRKYRLDELPQILNVLVGQMSLVGPRPERPEFVEGLSETIPYYAERHSVQPGVTGWAQLRYPYGSSEEDTKQKLQYDLYYVKNHNLLLDLLIILQTVEVVLWGKGAR